VVRPERAVAAPSERAARQIKPLVARKTFNGRISVERAALANGSPSPVVGSAANAAPPRPRATDVPLQAEA